MAVRHRLTNCTNTQKQRHDHLSGSDRSSGQYFFEADQLEKVLDKLESLGVTVVDSAESRMHPLLPWKCPIPH